MTLALAALLAVAAPPDSSLDLRNLHQQMLALELAEEMRAEGTMPEPADAAAFVEHVARAWAARVPDESETYRRLGTYAAMSATHVYDDALVPARVTCDVWERYAVPAFVADVEDLAGSEPSLDLAPLFFRPNLVWAYGGTLDCALSNSAWSDLTASLRRFRDAADAYLASSLADDDPDAGLREPYVAPLRNRAAGLLRLADLEGQIRDGDLDGAFAAIAGGLGGDLYPHVARGLGRRLAVAYAEGGQADRALAVYDLLGRSLADDTLPTARLAAWYAEAGAAPDRVARVRSDTDALLVPSDAVADLEGAFEVVPTGERLDLSSVLDGRFVLLDFWSVGCGPCIEHVPTLNRLADEYGDRLTVVRVNNDVVYGTPLAAVREAVERHGIETTVVTDTEDGVLTERFGVAGWPLYLLLDESGRVLVEAREGRRSLSLTEVEAYVADSNAR
jgi:thiol-disulfide isomerase/thioredoxin